jgi:hypothetical protein
MNIPLTILVIIGWMALMYWLFLRRRSPLPAEQEFRLGAYPPSRLPAPQDENVK